MSISEQDKYKIKKLVKQLRGYRGRHTELITVYIPAEYDINAITTHLSQEQGTASNIKSKGTRDNVQGALERMIQHLKLFKVTPPNGLAVFSGNISDSEGKDDFQVWSFEPPTPLKIRMYRCDKEFVLEPLQDLLEDDDVYGLVVMDRRDADFALLKGKTIVPLQSTHSEVPGKTRAGGQSAQRFERLREGATTDHFKKIAEYMKEHFLNRERLKGIILGGPGTTVNSFVDRGYITGDVNKKILAIKDLSYTGDFGLQELLEKSDDVLAEASVMEEKKIMQRFFGYLAKQPGMVSYGLNDVKKHLTQGAVDILLVSEEQDDDLIEELAEEADKVGSTVMVISVDTREGSQLKTMGGIAAIMRYEVSE